MERRKHQKPEIERVLRKIEKGGWRVVEAGQFFRCLCPCGKHLRTVHSTPSSSRYGINLLKHCQRFDCWEGPK